MLGSGSREFPGTAGHRMQEGDKGPVEKLAEGAGHRGLEYHSEGFDSSLEINRDPH